MTLHHIQNRTRKLPPLRVGIGGPVGSGKTTLLEMLCKAMRDRYDLVAMSALTWRSCRQTRPACAQLPRGSSPLS